MVFYFCLIKDHSTNLKYLQPCRKLFCKTQFSSGVDSMYPIELEIKDTPEYATCVYI